MEIVEILQKLISIPSWVDSNTNEREIGTWIFEYLKTNSNLKISKQQFGNGRFNIIAQKDLKTDTLVTGHIDTVQPNTNWADSPTSGKIIDGKIFGRGSSDMKCGVAIMLYLATLPNLKDGITFLFYCDEEYDFLGMKEFIKLYTPCKDSPLKFQPKLIISLDGGDLQIGNSCRGLIELKVKVIGKAGHSANPAMGINAISESMKVIGGLKKWLRNYSSKELGNSTLNIAYINGGGSQGNIIAEECEYIAEIRVANENLNAKLVKNFIGEKSEKLGLKVGEVIVRHDLGNWITSEKDLKDIIAIAPKAKIKSAKKSGYIDIQMLWKTFGKVPTFSLGCGESEMAHKANEYVKISNILKAQRFFERLLINK